MSQKCSLSCKTDSAVTRREKKNLIFSESFGKKKLLKEPLSHYYTVSKILKASKKPLKAGSLEQLSLKRWLCLFRSQLACGLHCLYHPGGRKHTSDWIFIHTSSVSASHSEAGSHGRDPYTFKKRCERRWGFLCHRMASQINVPYFSIRYLTQPSQNKKLLSFCLMEQNSLHIRVHFFNDLSVLSSATLVPEAW